MAEGLPRVEASSFRQRVLTIPLAFVLLCIPSDEICRQADAQLGAARAVLRAERSPVAIRLLDVSGEAGAVLCGQLGMSEPVAFYIFRRGVPTQYFGSIHLDDIISHLRRLAAHEDEFAGESAIEQARPPYGPSLKVIGVTYETSYRSQEREGRMHTPDPPGGGLLGSQMMKPAVLPLTPKGIESAVDAHPLLFVLFFDRERLPARNYLLSNFSSAAEALAAESIYAKLGWLQVPTDGEDHTALRLRFEVSELPCIKVFRRSKSYDYQGAADTASLVDIARWNSGTLMFDDIASKIWPIAGLESAHQVMKSNPPRLVLVSYTTHWCTRCHAVAARLVETSRLLDTDDKANPIVLASVNIGDPRNSRMLEQEGILAFPRQKVFWRGHLVVGDFPIHKETKAKEIADELVALRHHFVSTDAP